jgi:Raf kinase inhibitor-like YbhB/YbcL family protein
LDCRRAIGGAIVPHRVADRKTWQDGWNMPPAPKLRLVGGPLVLVMLAVSACRAGGATDQLPATEGAVQSAASDPGGFALSSPEFGEGQAIPRRYACDGDDISPPLAWSGAPGEAAVLALIVDDPDASGFVHWVVFDMTASATGSLSAGWSKSPDAPPQGTNGFGRVGYGGPCPPSGTHRYVFRLLALGEALALSGAPTARQVLDAAAGHILGEASLTGTYARGG